MMNIIMRPTDVGAIGVSIKTPGPGYPLVSKTGHASSFSTNTSSHSFGSSRRFAQYEIEAKKTGYRMGPGAYKPSNLSIGVARIIKTPLYRSESFVKGLPKTGYYYSGQALLYDEEILPKFFLSKKHKKGANSLYGRPCSLGTPVSELKQKRDSSGLKSSY